MFLFIIKNFSTKQKMAERIENYFLIPIQSISWYFKIKIEFYSLNTIPYIDFVYSFLNELPDNDHFEVINF